MAIPAAQTQTQHPVEGVLWMLATGLCFVAVTGIARYLGTELPTAQSAFLRFAWGLVFVAPAIWSLARQGLPAGSLPIFLGRGAVHSAAVLFWFYAMARIPVAEVTAIGFLNPVAVTIGAALIFGEKLASRRISAIAIAFLGALIILRPGVKEVTTGHLAQLCAAVLFAGSYLFAKRLSHIASAGMVVAMLSLTVTAGLLPLALAVWVPVSAAQTAWTILLAGFGTAAHYCMTRAFRAAPLSVTQPVTFLQLVWATILGAVVFGEAPDPFVILGGAIIICAISYIIWREQVAQRRAVTPSAEATEL